MTEPRQAPSVTRWQPIAGHTQELPRRHIKQDDARFWQFCEIIDPSAGFDFPTEFAQVPRQRIRDRLRPAARQRPARGVSGQAENQTDRGGSEIIQRKE